MGGAARLASAALAGGALVLAFPPYDLWPLAPVSVAVLALAVAGRGALPGAAGGLAYGLAFFVPLLHWSGIYVGAAPWLILAAGQAGFLAGFGALLALVTRLPGWPVWTAALWVGEEAARDRLPFGGFPWGRLAFSQADAPFLALARLGGAPLVTFAVALSGGLLAAAVRAARRRRSGAAAVAAGAAALVGATGLVVPLVVPLAVPLPVGERTLTVAVVQGNVPRLGLGFNAQRAAVLRDHVARTLQLAAEVRAGRRPRPALVVWPENASDIDPFDDPSAGLLIDRAVRAVGVPVLVGAVLDGPGASHASNVGVVWDPRTGPGERYVKRHPVPFAEYIPLRRIARLVSDKVDLVRREFVAGHRPGVLRVGPTSVGDVICFEVAYDSLVRDVATGGARLLVVQTNNATFGRSGETYQQLAMARLRAVEHGRTTLVAATSGISAIVAPDGRVVARTRVFTPAILDGPVPVSAGRTPATRLGAAPEWLLAVVGLLAVARAVGWRRTRPPDRPAGVDRRMETMAG